MPTSWLQLSVRGDPLLFDPLANFLTERGSPGVAIRKRELLAYFSRPSARATVGPDLRRYLRALRRLFPSIKEPRLRWSAVGEENWSRSWRRFIKPAKIGRSLWVTPPWLTPPATRRCVITIEPGMAFGTGTHATTRGCLEFIEKVTEPLDGKRFDALDVGTGSGILAIALAKLGARKVRALDNDPVALQVARENLDRNGVQKRVDPTPAGLRRIRKRFLLVVANLTAPTILELAGALASRVAPRGFLILSGILFKEASAVVRRFGAKHFHVVRRKREKEWVTLLLQRR